MIKFNNSDIIDWNFDDSNIIKVYHNGAIVFYKFDTEQGGYKVCYAVVDDITQYSDREFEDVYDKAIEKWFKLNNLNQYEQYGVYGSGRTSCEGSTSRLPQGYTEVEYIENTSTAYINTDLQIYSSTTNSFEVESKLIAAKHDSQTYQNVFSCMSEDGEPYQGFTYRYQFSSLVGTSIPNGQNTFTIVNNEDSTQTVTVTSSSSQRTYTHTYPLTLFCGLNSSRNPFRWTNSKFYYCKIKMNDELVRDFVPCKRDSDDKYGMYDLVTNAFYLSPNNVDFSGGEPITPTDCVTTYNGKLTVDDGYEYEWNGSSWVNLGEVSGSTELECLERTSTYNGYMPLGEYFTENTVIQMDFQMTQAKGNAIIGDYGSNDNDDWRVFLNYDSTVNNWLVYDFTNSRNYYNTGDWSKRFNIEIGNYYIKDLDTGNYLINTTSKTGFSRPNQMYLFHMEGRQSTNNIDYGKIYSVKIYQNNALVKDYAPWTDGNGNYGLYDKVSSSATQSIGSMTGATGGTIEYPVYYSEKSEPLDNLTFNTMEEADDYAYNNCVYVGFKAAINGDKYVFSGDSQSGYEWVYNPSRLPVGYTEVEYIENVTPNKAYIDTGFKPNQNTKVIADFQYVTTNTHPRCFGCGPWNGLAYELNAENGITSNGVWNWKFGQTSGWLTTGVHTDFNRHTAIIDSGKLYLDDTVIGSTTVTTFQLTDNIGLFGFIQNGSQGGSSSGEYMFGKFYSFKVYDNGTLARDLVPCKRDSDDKYGMYDIVNDVFYVSPNGNNFIGGDPV